MIERVQPSGRKIPCLICDEESHILLFPDSTLEKINVAAWDNAIHCESIGNYGSTVHDMNGKIHFIICDKCIRARSHKILITGHFGHPNKMENFADMRDRYEKSRSDGNDGGEA
jgi:hypothetical protein